MCPTRELVVQNLQVIRKLATFTDITSIGTNEMQPGRRQPPITQQIVVGTAGKLKSLIASRLLLVSSIRMLVFDEADQMLSNDGFGEESMQMIDRIRHEATEPQFLLFSATFDENCKEYCRHVRAPVPSRLAAGLHVVLSEAFALVEDPTARHRRCGVSSSKSAACDLSPGRSGAWHAAAQIMPRAENAFIAAEELSLDVIKQVCCAAAFGLAWGPARLSLMTAARPVPKSRDANSARVPCLCRARSLGLAVPWRRSVEPKHACSSA